MKEKYISSAEKHILSAILIPAIPAITILATIILTGESIIPALAGMAILHIGVFSTVVLAVLLSVYIYRASTKMLAPALTFVISSGLFTALFFFLMIGFADAYTEDYGGMIYMLLYLGEAIGAVIVFIISLLIAGIVKARNAKHAGE